MSSTSLRRTRRLLWAGLAVYVVGIAWDGAWHARNPDALETGWRLLQAHGVMYAGMGLALAGGLEAFARADRPSPASWYGLAAVGALAQTLGSSWDAWAHAAGGEAAVAHVLADVGLLAVLAGTVMVTYRARSLGA